MVRRVPVQSSRATYLRLADDASPELMRERMARLRILRDVGAQGLKLLDGSTPERRRRLQRFHDFYSFMEREFKPIIDRWDAEHPREDT